MLFAVSNGMHCDAPESIELARDLTVNLCLHGAPTVNLSRRSIVERHQHTATDVNADRFPSAKEQTPLEKDVTFFTQIDQSTQRAAPSLLNDAALRKRSTLLRTSAPALILVIDLSWFFHQDSLLELYYILRSVFLGGNLLVVPVLDALVVHVTNLLLQRRQQPELSSLSVLSATKREAVTSPLPPTTDGNTQQNRTASSSNRNPVDATLLATQLHGTFVEDALVEIVPWIARALFFLTTDLSVSEMTAKLINLAEELQLTPEKEPEFNGGVSQAGSDRDSVSRAVPGIGERVGPWELYEKSWAALGAVRGTSAATDPVQSHSITQMLSSQTRLSAVSPATSAIQVAGTVQRKPNSGVGSILRPLTGCSIDTIRSITRLSFRNLVLGDLGVHALCLALRFTVPCLETLDLSGNSIRDGGCRAVCTTFQDHPSLRNLLLESNLITAGGAASLFFLLDENTQIVGLSLLKNVVEATSRVWIRRLVQLLRRNRALLFPNDHNVLMQKGEEEKGDDCDPRLLTEFRFPNEEHSSKRRQMNECDLDDYFLLGDFVLKAVPQWHTSLENQLTTLEAVWPPRRRRSSNDTAADGAAAKKRKKTAEVAQWVQNQQDQPLQPSATVAPPSAVSSQQPLINAPIPKCGEVIRDCPRTTTLSMSVVAGETKSTANSGEVIPNIELHLQLGAVGVDMTVQLKGMATEHASTSAATSLSLDAVVVYVIHSLLSQGVTTQLLNLSRVNGTKLPLVWSSSNGASRSLGTIVKKQEATTAQQQQQQMGVTCWDDAIRWDGRRAVVHASLTSVDALKRSLPPPTCTTALNLLYLWVLQFVVSKSPPNTYYESDKKPRRAATSAGTNRDASSSRNPFVDAFYRYVLLGACWDTPVQETEGVDSDATIERFPRVGGRLAEAVPISLRISTSDTMKKATVSVNPAATTPLPTSVPFFLELAALLYNTVDILCLSSMSQSMSVFAPSGASTKYTARPPSKQQQQLLPFQRQLDRFFQPFVPSAATTESTPSPPPLAVHRSLWQVCPHGPQIIASTVPKLVRSDRVERCSGNLVKEVASLLQLIALMVESDCRAAEDQNFSDLEDDYEGEDGVHHGNKVSLAQKHLKEAVKKEEEEQEEHDAEVKVNVAARWNTSIAAR